VANAILGIAPQNGAPTIDLFEDVTLLTVSGNRKPSGFLFLPRKDSLIFGLPTVRPPHCQRTATYPRPGKETFHAHDFSG
jgi:hypothetical protein